MIGVHTGHQPLTSFLNAGQVMLSLPLQQQQQQQSAFTKTSIDIGRHREIIQVAIGQNKMGTGNGLSKKDCGAKRCTRCGRNSWDN